MFTSCLKYDEITVPQVICSDDTSHTKFQIAIYLFKVLSKLPSKTKVLKIWSDGPSSQFKNKFMAALIQLLETRFKVKVVWNFFATSHGKGSVDGLGAVVKNRVKRLVKSRRVIVNSSADFVNAFNLEHSLINVVNLNESEAKKIRTLLKLDSVFDSAKSVPNIFTAHQLQVDPKSKKVIGFCTSQEGYKSFNVK